MRIWLKSLMMKAFVRIIQVTYAIRDFLLHALPA